MLDKKLLVDFVDKNIKMVNKLQGTNFNIFFEQVLLYEMVLSEGKTTGCFIHENIGDNQYHDFDKTDAFPWRNIPIPLRPNDRPIYFPPFVLMAR